MLEHGGRYHSRPRPAMCQRPPLTQQARGTDDGAIAGPASSGRAYPRPSGRVFNWWQGTFGLGSHEGGGHLWACGAPCRTYNAFALLRLSAYGIATKGKPLLGTTGSL